MPRYKLTYFDFRGRAELIRMTLCVAGQDFEDIRLSHEDFMKIKNDLPQNRLPILEFDGRTLPQSMTIVRYLAREYGLYGDSSLESAVVDTVLDTYMDTVAAIVRAFYEEDKQIKNQLATDLSDTGMPRFIGIFGKLLRQNNGGDGWLAGTKMTVADLAIYTLFDDLLGGAYGADLAKSILVDDKLKSHFDRVKHQKPISDWIEKRPQTER